MNKTTRYSIQIGLSTLTILLFIAGCSNKKNKYEIPKKVINNKILKLDSLNASLVNLLKPIESTNWVSEYKSVIIRENPEFKLDSNKVLNYWVVPMLIIPGNVLVKDSINLLKYFEDATLTFEDATCYVIENDIPVAIFQMNNTSGRGETEFSPSLFGNYIRDEKIESAKKSKLYFKIGIKDETGLTFFPGIVFLSDNKFKVLCYEDNTIYPIKEIYRTLFSDKESFIGFINRIAERNKQLNK
jgi:hypothetical protein